MGHAFRGYIVIRIGKFADIPRLTELMAEMYERSKYKGRAELDIPTTKSLFMSAMQRQGSKSAGGSTVIVAENNGIVEAFIVGILDRVYHVGNKLMATDLFYYATEKADARDSLRLLDEFLKWAEEIPTVIEIRMGATDAIGDWSRTEKLYRRKGMEQAGVIYERKVQ